MFALEDFQVALAEQLQSWASHNQWNDDRIKLERVYIEDSGHRVVALLSLKRGGVWERFGYGATLEEAMTSTEDLEQATTYARLDIEGELIWIVNTQKAHEPDGNGVEWLGRN